MLLALLAFASPAPFQIAGAEPVWAYVDYGRGIGASGILLHHGLRGPELIVSASRNSLGSPSEYWYVLTRRTDRSPCEYVSPLTGIHDDLELGDVLGTGRPQLAIMDAQGVVTLIDADTRRQLARLTLPVTLPSEMALGDSDGDGRDEIHVSEAFRLAVFDGNGALEWSSPVSMRYGLDVVEADGDPSPEVVSGIRVLDAFTRQIEWDLPPGLAGEMKAADVDGDGLAELITLIGAAPSINVLEVDHRALLWSQPLLATGVLATGDLDGDGSEEILIGERGTGYLVGYAGATGAEFCRIANPFSAISGILAADVDSDGEVELVWGAEIQYEQDRLLISDWRTGATEWQSESIEGQFVGPRIGDLTGDGLPEVVAATAGKYGHNGRLLVFDDKDLDLLAVSDLITTGGTALYGVEDLELGDIDGDGALEILVATGLERVPLLFAYKYADGSVTRVWTNATGPANANFWQVDAADLDGDGRIEVIGAAGSVWIHGADPAIYVYDAQTGQERWHTPALAGLLESPQGLEVRDLDSDGHQELVSFAHFRSAYIYDPVTRQLEFEIPGAHAFLDSYEIAGVPTLVLADDFGQLQFWQYFGGTYQLVRTDSLPSNSGFDLLQPGPRGLAWVGINGLQLMDLPTRTVHWSLPDYRHSGSAVVHPPDSRIEFLVANDYSLIGFRGR